MDELLRRLILRKAEIERSLAQGIARGIEDYRALVGEYSGLQYAQNQLEAILNDDENREL